MKILIFTLLLCTIYSSESSSQANDSAELSITITNVRKITGRIQIGIYNENSDFLSTDGQFRVVYEEVKSDTVVSIIKDLPVGEYGIAIYHDENLDNECNKNFLGIPKEPYGFSTNFKPRFRKPNFNDIKISFPEESSISIQLRH